MHKMAMLLVLLCSAAMSIAHTEETEHVEGIYDRDSLTNGFFGLNEAIEDKGLEVALSATQAYQQNVRGGLSTHKQAGRYSSRYDLELIADMSEFAGIKGGSVYMLTEGGLSEGISDRSVGSIFNTNAVAMGNEAADIVQLWYQQFFGDSFAIRLGKIDLTGGFECRGCPVTFDGNRFANDETTQFLNSALVNNPTIHFPDEGLGAILFYNPIEWWYASVGVADAQADRRETGFKTTFHDEDFYLYIFETGVTPQFESANGSLQGAYRIGIWYDPQDKERFSDGSIKRDDTGFYLSFDQTLLKENNQPDDEQGLGALARYGYASGSVNEVTNFISGGLQYTGLFEGRDNDVIAAGIAHGILTDRSEFTEDAETVYEAYYNAEITKWLHVTPSIQYINNTGGGSADDAVVIAVRALIYF